MNISNEKLDSEVFNDLFEIMVLQGWLKGKEIELSSLWGILETAEQRALLKELIKSFIVFDQHLESGFHVFFTDFMLEKNLKYDTTWLVGAANNKEVDGSSAFLQKMKNKIEPVDCWHSRFRPSIPSCVDDVKNGDTIILFDDFVGTGQKLVKKKTWMCGLLQKRGIEVDTLTFVFLSVAAMCEGADYILQSTGYDLDCYLLMKKAISDSEPTEEVDKKILIMRDIECNLGGRYKSKKLEDYSFGYNGSESIYCELNGNCPNNVFPVFWWPVSKNGSRRQTLFVRAG